MPLHHASQAAPHDVAIIGSGFAGTILARILRQRGQRVLLLEKGHHPRFALGESTTPLANFALERLAQRSGLDDLHQLATYGRWMEHLPHLHRGLKRGFTFYRHQRGIPFRNGEDNRSRLLVAASPEDPLADSHWLRSDVDHHLVRRAIDEGVEVHQSTTVEGVEETPDHLTLSCSRQGAQHSFHARYVVDASGPAAVLPRSLGDPPRDAETLPQAALVYCHVDGPPPFSEAVDASVSLAAGPYDDERAAVHHLLDNGWIYVLPFDSRRSADGSSRRLASVGAVLFDDPSSPHVPDVRRCPEDVWQRLLRSYPTLHKHLAGCRPRRPWGGIQRLAHRQSRAAGRRWFLLPHTFAFIDPMFSTGMAWSLLAVERLCDLLATADPGQPPVDGRAYDRLLQGEADQLTRLIAAARLAADDFELFKHITFLYFATVSRAELRQRLVEAQPGDPPACWEGFLGASDERLVTLFEDVRERLAKGQRETLSTRIRQALVPFDAIGLFAPNRRNLYPVDLDLLIERCHLLGLDRSQILAALPRLRGDS